MTDSLDDQGGDGAGDGTPDGTVSAGESGPDPVIGAGLALLGILLMGLGGARDAHYVFNVGVLTAVLGAGTFVLFVALSAMRSRQGPSDGGQPG